MNVFLFVAFSFYYFRYVLVKMVWFGLKLWEESKVIKMHHYKRKQWNGVKVRFVKKKDWVKTLFFEKNMN